ncbi:hypothetical protein [Rufibacter hautae]|uniref:Lipoprotein n=1 Tax=Rufibacter hautae TaxID=2595005 RepID=A0A5B6TKV3_9BACT|nr:hypothetical protein [Rufibacter hautae]KAA3440025.1 hypothetical protein FOA19_04980 [Rufibacter hautae]
MKKSLHFAALILIVFSCNSRIDTVQEPQLPSFTVNGKEYLNITKSRYYPAFEKRPLKEFEKADGRIILGSSDGFILVTAKIWIVDSMFKNLAEKENLKYSKTFFLDTTNKVSPFDFTNGFEVKSISGDTAYFHLTTKKLQFTEKEIKERWRMKINCHFEDKNGLSVDTFFVSRFNADWMK